MYCKYFSLKKKPFQISSDNEFLWMGKKHASALLSLKKGMDEGHLLLALIGDIGTGKTTIINEIIHTLNADTVFVKIENPCFEVSQLFLLIARAFGFENQYKDGINFSSVFLSFLKSAAEKNTKVLVIVDEAQEIPEKFLKEIVSWSKFGLNHVLTVILAGQLELKKILKMKSGQAGGDEKIVQAFLEPLNEAETKIYINKRLEMAGSCRRIFLISAIHEAYIQSRGIPRLINIHCDHALMVAYAKNIKIVDVPTFNQAIHELALPAEMAEAEKTEVEEIETGAEEKVRNNQPGKKAYAQNLRRPQKRKIAGPAMACLILLGIAFLLYTGYLPSVIKKTLFHFQGHVNLQESTSKETDAAPRNISPPVSKAMEHKLSETVILKTSENKQAVLKKIGLGYTPLSSYQDRQLPAMSGKIPLNTLEVKYSEQKQKIGLGYNGHKADLEVNTDPTEKTKIVAKNTKSAPISEKSHIKHSRILAENSMVQISEHKTSESPASHPKKNMVQSPEEPAPGAIIDWLINKRHIKPK